MLDLNLLRDQLRKTEPVQVTRSGQLVTEAGRPLEGREAGPSRIKRHTFADTRVEADCRLMDEHTEAWRRLVDGVLTFEEKVETNFGVVFHFRMTVPPSFPAAAPRVYCLAPEVPKTMDYHTWNDGHLCLFQPWEWQPTFTLLDVRNFYCEWAFNVVVRLYGGEGWVSPEHA